jgi:DNA-binding NtrC family response regulator
MGDVRIVVDERVVHDLLRKALQPEDAGADEACGVIVVQLTGDRSGKGAAAVRRLREIQPDAVVIAVAVSHTAAITQQAVRLRIDDFYLLPGELAELQAAVAARVSGKETPTKRAPSNALLGRSAVMEGLRKYINRVALTDSSVLVTGETGTGKELVAETLHRQGARHAAPFVSVNSAALPDSLFESEMFGYERGAFTGAHARHAGKLRQANRGTIFFDEIGDIGANAQAKLLRALETREVLPLGGARPASVDVRVIAATNRDLESMTRSGAFRADLFYRLNVVRVELPPLREHVEDISDLVRHFVGVFNEQFGRRARFDEDAIRALESHDYPGNVRELRNIVESSFVNSTSDVIGRSDLPQRLSGAAQARSLAGGREELLHTLTVTRWNITQAASQLRCSRMTIYRKLAEFKLSRSAV